MTEDSVAKLWAKPNDLIVNSHNVRDKFIKSLFYNNLELFNAPPKNEQISRTSVLEEQYIAMMLIQAWEDFLTLRNFIITEDLPWFCTFIQWAQSPYLKEYFDKFKYIFRDTTIELGTLLFEYAHRLPVPTPNPDDYPRVVNELFKDPKLTEIFEAPSKKK